MANVWRIHLKRDIETSPDYGKYCLKKNIAAMGWILDKHNPDLASGKIAITCFEEYETYARDEGFEPNQIRQLAKEIKPGDFIWARVDGKYYIAKVAENSRYSYNVSDEAMYYRACNELSNIYWKLVGERKDVDSRILERMERGQTLCRMFDSNNPNFNFGLKYSQEIFDRIGEKKTALYGAILGDIVGVPYEFDRKTVDDINFPLFCDESNFSDDTVTTIAIADAILKSGKSDEETFQNELINSLQTWCRKYPKSGYGGRFHDWINSDNPKPYNSYGNGAAMRVSAAGWFYDTIFDTREAARKTAYITHNHPEGIKGAMAAASAIFLARNGKSKSEIKNYIASEFGYDLDRTIEEIRPNYTHTEKIWKTVPEAIIAFLESEDFEGALRNVVWLGGDTDTLGAIAGSIAEAFYGIPDNLIKECRSRIPQDMLDVVDKFNSEIFAHKSEIPTISPERMARFTYSAEEIESLKFYPSTEAWVEECKKKGLKVHLYGSESAD